ncbi:unnamed protein product [Zymoseptoria tritici ST99CH_1E4]|uniref:Potassium transport protein n=1 Tax=Zymoseptoria tritici ST99CH_1E4 TaxID=1276532 RepID=A0A2H1GTP6_ZYMTR|nr:unnamed protein product [Zymoseptoria tritici ST99CH_1E4]
MSESVSESRRRGKSQWASDVFGPVIEAGKWIQAIFPTRFRPHRPKFNFIMVHYSYIVGMAIFTSILLYPAGLLPYPDALFFAVGCATQSGLNTVDINLLHTYQQVVMMLITCICTPIFINTVVVLIRLYWFEKRFEHIVRETRAQRRTRARSLSSRSRSQMKSETSERTDDPSQNEKGVNGRRIVVLRDSLNPGGMSGAQGKAEDRRRELLDKLGMDSIVESSDQTPESSRSDSSDHEGDGPKEVSSSHSRRLSTRPETPPGLHPSSAEVPRTPQSPSVSYMGLHPKLNREITFADEVPKNLEPTQSTSDMARIPEHSDISRHVEFLERQQNDAKKGGAFYIPGPRDFDRGEVPEQIAPDEEDTIERLPTRSDRARSPDHKGIAFADEEHPKRNITIDVPEHPAHRDRRSTEEPSSSSPVNQKSAFSRMRSNSNRLGERSRSFAQTWTNITQTFTQSRDEEPMPYFAWSATTGRNSAFLGLTAEQREELGGIEYRSLKTLVKILLSYYVGFHVLGMVVFLPWITNTYWQDTVRSFGQNPAWWGVFTPASMFNDLGFTLTANSMIGFQDSVLALLFGSFLIIIGNTGFPCLLRFIIWTLSKMVPRDSGIWEELRFLLDHPRRCFTLLFPSKATWWLFWVLILLNGIDLMFFIILDLNQAAVTALHPGLQVLNGWFQAVSTRTAGFASVNLADLHSAIQVSYMIMMYISIFPIAISVRRTNVYEEQSLGLFGGEETAAGDGEPSYVSMHLRRQLSFDLWYIFLGLFIITIVEGDRIADPGEPSFTIFAILFEIVSAYGTVGLSLGYPTINASFSAEFKTISKLIIIAMMVRGRHRGLPYALDRAILLPSEKLQQKEAEESERRTNIRRRGSAFAEENNTFNRNTTWEDSELDNYGLPRQHTIDQVTTGGASAEHDAEGMRRLHTRRSTAMSTSSASGGKNHKRARSLGRVIASGLSAGPSTVKRD